MWRIFYCIPFFPRQKNCIPFNIYGTSNFWGAATQSWTWAAVLVCMNHKIHKQGQGGGQPLTQGNRLAGLTRRPASRTPCWAFPSRYGPEARRTGGGSVQRKQGRPCRVNNTPPPAFRPRHQLPWPEGRSSWFCRGRVHYAAMIDKSQPDLWKTHLLFYRNRLPSLLHNNNNPQYSNVCTRTFVLYIEFGKLTFIVIHTLHHVLVCNTAYFCIHTRIYLVIKLHISGTFISQMQYSIGTDMYVSL